MLRQWPFGMRRFCASAVHIARDDSASLAKLSHRLQDARTTRSAEALLCTRLDGVNLSRCRVAQSLSPGAGNGVFATRGISEGEVVTLFPGDWLLNFESAADSWQRTSSSHASVMFGDHLPDDMRDEQHATSTAAREYAFALSPYISLIGDAMSRDDPAYLGHLMNDCAAMTDPNEIITYALAAATRMNAAHILLEDCHVATVATRDITQGDEIVVTCEYSLVTTQTRLYTPG